LNRECESRLNESTRIAAHNRLPDALFEAGDSQASTNLCSLCLLAKAFGVAFCKDLSGSDERLSSAMSADAWTSSSTLQSEPYVKKGDKMKLSVEAKVAVAIGALFAALALGTIAQGM
jgi:hypothetical protein